MEDNYKVEIDPADSAEEEAAFEATFATADQEPAQQQTEPEAEPEAQAEPEIEQPSEEAPATSNALTIEALRDMLEEQKRIGQQSHAKLSGTVGELKQRIDAIKQTSSGLSPKARERLDSEFPELSAMLFDGIDDAPPEQEPAPYYPPAVDNSSAVEEVKQTFEKKLLKVHHPDWEATVKTQDFVDWRSNVLSPEDAVQLADTWDSDYVAEKLTEFKAYRAKMAKQAQDKINKEKRLDSAITPRGVQRQTNDSYSEDDEDAAMMAAFKHR